MLPEPENWGEGGLGKLRVMILEEDISSAHCGAQS